MSSYINPFFLSRFILKPRYTSYYFHTTKFPFFNHFSHFKKSYPPIYIQKKEIQPGWIQIVLTKYYIYLEEDFFIGVEFIPDFKNSIEVYLGVILTKGKGYQRSSSQGKWNKLQGGSTINVEVEY